MRLTLTALLSLMLFNMIQAAPSLSKIQQQSKKTSQQLQSNQNRYQTLQSQLKKNETYISTLAQSINKIKQQLKQNKRKSQQLLKQQRKLKQQITQAQKILSQQLRSAYMIGEQSYLKTILNLKNPSHLNRIITYYRAFSQQQLDSINALKQHMSQLQQVTVAQTVIRKQLFQLLRKKQKAQDSY